MPKIAVDIALIPPDDVLDQIVKLNRELITEKQEIILGKENYLPHCTVSMGIVDSEKIPDLWNHVVALANKTGPIHFKARTIETTIRPDGVTKISGIDC